MDPDNVNSFSKVLNSGNVLLVTDVDFWNGGAGHRMRISTLAEFIASRAQLTIIFTGIANSLLSETTISEKFQCRFIAIEPSKILSPGEYGEFVRTFSEKNHFDFCIIEYIHNSYLLNYLPGDMKFILDAHDIISERKKSFADHHHEHNLFDIPEELEYEIFEVYDYVMLLCKPDIDKLSKIIPAEKLLLCPHPAAVCQHEIKKIAHHIGFIGSEYLPNKDAIEFFINECWPSISKKFETRLQIYGNIARTLNLPKTGNSIQLNGYVENLAEIYNQIDIVINPVRFGAGLKIKNIEALANGLPLITTSHGARGIEKGAGKSFLVADDASSIIDALEKLIPGYEMRKSLSENAYHFMNENFSAEICFGPLMKVLSPPPSSS